MDLHSPQRVLRELDSSRLAALAGEAEGVHDVRGSLRRLRVWVQLGRHRWLDRELRWLTRELSDLRDLDVLEPALSPEARAELRPAAVLRARTALQSERWLRLRSALEAAEPPSPKKAKKRLTKLERRLGRAMAQRVKTGEALHALRRLVRRVRMTRKWLGKKTTGFDQLQRGLGALCDVLLLERFAAAQDASRA